MSKKVIRKPECVNVTLNVTHQNPFPLIFFLNIRFRHKQLLDIAGLNPNHTFTANNFDELSNYLVILTE